MRRPEQESNGAAGAPLAIGLVGPLPPPAGGIANQTAQLARLLAETGIAVDLVRSNTPYRPAWIGRVPRLRAVFRLLPYIAALWRCAGRVELFHVMANSGWSWHLFAAPAVWIATLRGKPVVVNYRGGEADAFLAAQHHWLAPTLKRAAAVVVPSLFLAAVFAKRSFATVIVPNIVDLDLFQPAMDRQPGHHLIVTRNLEDLYDIPTALKAFAIVRSAHADARLTVAGGGERRGQLEELCVQLGIAAAVRFTGSLDNARMAEIYRDADLLLNPSLADNMPVSLLEAMASGVPIVTTNVGGIPYLVAHEQTALLVEPGAPAAMAAAALRLFAEPQLAMQLRENGMAQARRHSWKQARHRLLGVYGQALGRSSLEGAA